MRHGQRTEVRELSEALGSGQNIRGVKAGDERPTLIVLDEAWKLLDDPYFEGHPEAGEA